MEVTRERPQRLLPPTYTPSLVFSHGENYNDQTFYTLSDQSRHLKSVPEIRGTTCVASNFGWLILQSRYTNHCYIFNPISLIKIRLPMLSHKSRYAGALTHPPNNPNCKVVLVSSERKKFIYCRIGEENWIKKKLGFYRKKDISRKCNLLYGQINVVNCDGKIYVFFAEGMTVIDIQGTDFSFKLHNWKSPRFSTDGFNRKRNFYVESCEEIFMVTVAQVLDSPDIIEKLEVFKLDFGRRVFVNVETLGDRIFLLSENSTASVSAGSLGMRGNRVYFSLSGDRRLYSYDMESGSINVTLPCSSIHTHLSPAFWMVPNFVPRGVKEESKEINSWTRLPREILVQISSRLVFSDCIRFRLTCRAWMSMTNRPTRPLTVLLQSRTKPKMENIPCLLSLPYKSKCNLHHPNSDVYTVNLPAELAGAIVRHAKYEWLLMSKENSIFFFNPVTGETIKLPEQGKSYTFYNISFSCPPTSSECMVFGHRQSSPRRIYSEISMYRKNKNKWFDYQLDSMGSQNFVPSYSNPIFYDGFFYSLGKDGRLAVFNEEVWQVLPVPAVISFGHNDIHSTSLKNFLLEYDEEIISIFLGDVGLLGKPVWVFKLKESRLEWVRVESLGNNVIFLSHTTSIAAKIKGMENRIYLPKFYGEEIVYYSLETRHYHCLGSDELSTGWTNTFEYWNYTWFQFREKENMRSILIRTKQHSLCSVLFLFLAWCFLMNVCYT